MEVLLSFPIQLDETIPQMDIELSLPIPREASILRMAIMLSILIPQKIIILRMAIMLSTTLLEIIILLMEQAQDQISLQDHRILQSDMLLKQNLLQDRISSLQETGSMERVEISVSVRLCLRQNSNSEIASQPLELSSSPMVHSRVVLHDGFQVITQYTMLEVIM